MNQIRHACLFVPLAIKARVPVYTLAKKWLEKMAPQIELAAAAPRAFTTS